MRASPICLSEVQLVDCCQLEEGCDDCSTKVPNGAHDDDSECKSRPGSQRKVDSTCVTDEFSDRLTLNQRGRVTLARVSGLEKRNAIDGKSSRPARQRRRGLRAALALLGAAAQASETDKPAIPVLVTPVLTAALTATGRPIVLPPAHAWSWSRPTISHRMPRCPSTSILLRDARMSLPARFALPTRRPARATFTGPRLHHRSDRTVAQSGQSRRSTSEVAGDRSGCRRPEQYRSAAVVVSGRV